MQFCGVRIARDVVRVGKLESESEVQNFAKVASEARGPSINNMDTCLEFSPVRSVDNCQTPSPPHPSPTWFMDGPQCKIRTPKYFKLYVPQKEAIYADRQTMLIESIDFMERISTSWSCTWRMQMNQPKSIQASIKLNNATRSVQK